MESRSLAFQYKTSILSNEVGCGGKLKTKPPPNSWLLLLNTGTHGCRNLVGTNVVVGVLSHIGNRLSINTSEFALVRL